MILRLGYKVLPKTEKVFVIDIYLNHVHSINSEKATAWPFLYSQGMADLVKRRH